MATKVIITDWRKYHPLSKEEMQYLYENGRSTYEIAAISCPPEYTWSQWIQHLYSVMHFLTRL